MRVNYAELVCIDALHVLLKADPFFRRTAQLLAFPCLKTVFHKVGGASRTKLGVLLTLHLQYITREIQTGANDRFLERAIAEWSTFSPVQKTMAVIDAVAHRKVSN